MRIKLQCPCCECHFRAEPEAPAAEVLDRMTEEGPWFALGDGENFEEMIVAALLQRGQIGCPECGCAVSFYEESFEDIMLEKVAVLPR